MTYTINIVVVLLLKYQYQHMLNVDKSWLEVINICIKESENNNVIAQYITFLKSKPFQWSDFSYSYLCLILT